METNKNSNNKIIVISIISALAIAIVALLIFAPKNEVSNVFEAGTNNISIVKSDTPIIEKMVDGVVDSDIEIISNQNNEQADVILAALNIDIRDIYSYAGSIDPRFESAHAVLIVRPKENKMEIIKEGIRTYLFEKQSYFENSELQNSDMLNIIKSAILYNTNEYVVLVMEENPNDILLELSKQLKQQEAKD